MQPDLVRGLIGCLELMAAKPDIVRKLVPHGQELGYVAGLGLGIRFALDIAKDPLRERELRHQVVKSRGWSIDQWPHEQMQERGLSGDALLTELVGIEIDFIRLASSPGDG